ncbi:beta-ketoacyl-[acyl-carrier-protein] synthase family protein [Novosphingobium sp. 2580]|uniref:Nodulation protein E n=2 Tax=Novosphingobium album (ex Hu et al. 2023) TaxID=2930093 RepID=A0ABT0B6Y1_9SPHN|nr:beta-ketoacyl-[acyl-carrier-protein] synthase family protein [Novosphingobium album (ex Hu et al. 2023)]
MGAISATGIGIDALWEAARTGSSGVGPIVLEHARGNRIHIGAAVSSFDPAVHIDEASLRTCDRHAQFAVVAAREAIAAAGLAPSQLLGNRTAVILGTGAGGIGTLDDGCRAYYSGERFDTFAVPRGMASSASCHLSIAHGITGPTFAVTSACASASQAIGIAAQLIRSGLIDRAITGGAEACLTPATMRTWEYLRVLTADACRPFSVGRSGMVIGEGAGICILESEDALLARGGRAQAWLSGFGTSSDARDMVQPDVDGAASAVSAALTDAGLTPEAIGYINAHGTGTVANDINEALALRAVFSDSLDTIPLSSSKPIIGHTLGASGALELLITIRALQEQTIPPQINCRGIDPKCALNIQLDEPAGHSFDAALSNSFAFGGINAALIVGRAN